MRDLQAPTEHRVRSGPLDLLADSAGLTIPAAVANGEEAAERTSGLGMKGGRR